MEMYSLKNLTNEFEKIKNMPNKNKCNICFMNIDPYNITTLKCSHEFHYSCIKDWYKVTLSHRPNTIPRECPYCRKPGGYLPLREGDIYDKSIHTYVQSHRCKANTKMGQQCKHTTREGEYCHIHRKKN